MARVAEERLTEVCMEVNGEQACVYVEPGERLIDTLRERLRLTGVKEGCGVGECGACTVLVNGDAVNSCLILTVQCQDAGILTVEGLAHDGRLSMLQQCFLDHGAVQCGFCTPGMLMSAMGLLLKNPSPTREEIKAALAGNLCRCTGYEQIIEAVEAAVEGGAEDGSTE